MVKWLLEQGSLWLFNDLCNNRVHLVRCIKKSFQLKTFLKTKLRLDLVTGKDIEKRENWKESFLILQFSRSRLCYTGFQKQSYSLRSIPLKWGLSLLVSGCAQPYRRTLLKLFAAEEMHFKIDLQLVTIHLKGLSPLTDWDNSGFVIF